MAIGIGGYFDIGAGSTTWSGDLSGGTTDLVPTGGLILDTAAAKNKIFNYRLKFGGGKMLSGDLKLDKVGMVHTFGLSPSNMRGDEARFFFGPRIGLHYVGGKYMSLDAPDPLMFLFLGPYAWLLSGDKMVHFDMFRFDLGLVLLGFNFNLGEHATLTFEFGFDYGIMLGGDEASITANGIEGFATLGFMYRINDRFGAVQKNIERPDENKMSINVD